MKGNFIPRKKIGIEGNDDMHIGFLHGCQNIIWRNKCDARSWIREMGAALATWTRSSCAALHAVGEKLAAPLAVRPNDGEAATVKFNAAVVKRATGARRPTPTPGVHDINDGKEWSEDDLRDLRWMIAYGSSVEATARFLCPLGTVEDVALKIRELELQVWDE